MSHADWEAARPALSPEQAVALDVWSFCGGWRPDLLGLAAEWYRVDDIELLIEGCLTIRDAIEAHRRATS